MPSAEQPVQRSSYRLLGILMDPAVIIGIVWAINPASGLFAQTLQRVQLLLGDGHWSCREFDSVRCGLLRPYPGSTRMPVTALPLRGLPAIEGGLRIR